MEYNTTIEKQGYASTGMVEVPKYTMPNPFRFTPEEQASYFTQLQQQYADNCTQAENEMRAWEIGYEFHHDPPLDLEAYTLKINEQLKVLTNQDPGLIVAKFYHNGILDSLKLGKYLVSLYLHPEKQRTATATFHAIVYLSSQKDKLEEQSPSGITKEQPTLPKDEDTHWLCQVLERLSPHWETPERYPILYALRDYCDYLGYAWAESCMKFANKIVSLLPFKIKDTSLNTALCNAAKNIKVKETKSYRRLATLLPKNILDCDDAEKECKLWKSRLEIVKEAMKLDSEI